MLEQDMEFKMIYRDQKMTLMNHNLEQNECPGICNNSGIYLLNFKLKSFKFNPQNENSPNNMYTSV